MALVESWLLIRYGFVDQSADMGGAVDDALTALVDGLGDRWSYYLDAEWNEYVAESRANNYVGIGVSVSYEREEGLLILSVSPDGPAEKAGLRPEDIITAVDGTSIAGEMRSQATDLIKGEAGTWVTLTILHPDGVTDQVTCKRGRVKNSSARSTMLQDNVGYVLLENFYSNSSASFRTEVNSLLDQGAESLIIDLRDNPGGYLAELKKILNFLLPEGPVLTQDSRWWFKTTYQSDAECVDLPMVVLVNTETYSAAELLAAQLRESAGVPIVGEHTSGKGYSQIIFPLPNGGGLGLSTATYSTGSDHSLIGEGIIPDVETSDRNEQLQTAIDLLIE